MARKSRSGIKKKPLSGSIKKKAAATKKVATTKKKDLKPHKGKPVVGKTKKAKPPVSAKKKTPATSRKSVLTPDKAKTLSLIDDGIKSISLNILVFGPQVHTLSKEERTRDLQNKRKEIRAALEKQGHTVRYAEDLVEPNLTDPHHNEFIQELVIMREYDFIVNLVDSPGSISEATVIAQHPQLANKAALFVDEQHSDGLVAKACKNAQNMGAVLSHYKYPTDLVECHLLGHVIGRADQIRMMKFLS